uniref:Chromo domain-containing protein n=1 Tax=Peronospora matthiolae TaxID=2874970 RepID=A0AAV1VL53_9STRA
MAATSSTPPLEAVTLPQSSEAAASARVSNEDESGVALEKELPTVEVAGTSLDKPLVKKKRRRDYSSKAKPQKKKMRDAAKCVGYYVDALDKKLLWGEASIIQCNVATRKIKVHFVGWSKNHDIWTDVKSITAHGRYAPCTKDNTVKSWNGDMRLFEDVLSKVEETSLTPVPGPVEDTRQVTLLPASFTEKAGEKQEVSRVDHIKRSAPKRKADVDREKKPGLKRTLVTQKLVKKTEGHRHESVRRLKQVKKQESVGNRRPPVQCLTKQKREGPHSTALTIAKACASTKERAVFSNELPVFCNLELDDGTVMDFSVQREKARVKREAMQSFLDECAVIWKNQLHVLPK